MDSIEGSGYFTVVVDVDAEPAVVSAAGELDSASSAELHAAIDEAHARGAGVRLDLEGLTFIDSSGLRVITVALQRAKDEDVTFEVSSMSDAVRRIFDVTGVSSLLE